MFPLSMNCVSGIPCLGTARQLQSNVDVFLLGRLMERINGFAIHGDFERLRVRCGTDAVEGGLFLVDDEEVLFLIRLALPINVHHAGHLLEDAFHLLRKPQALLLIGAIDLRHQRLQ